MYKSQGQALVDQLIGQKITFVATVFVTVVQFGPMQLTSYRGFSVGTQHAEVQGRVYDLLIVINSCMTAIGDHSDAAHSSIGLTPVRFGSSVNVTKLQSSPAFGDRSVCTFDSS